jgi:hypothetical protein
MKETEELNLLEFPEDYELQVFTIEDFRYEEPFYIPDPTTLGDW